MLQVMGFTLKVQFKKTGLATSAAAPVHSASFDVGLPGGLPLGSGGAGEESTPPLLPLGSAPAALGSRGDNEAAFSPSALGVGACGISFASYAAFVAPPSSPSLEELHKLVAAKLKQARQLRGLSGSLCLCLFVCVCVCLCGKNRSDAGRQRARDGSLGWGCCVPGCVRRRTCARDA